nr:hypothetical protein [Tanacetum cinerariifolium]
MIQVKEMMQDNDLKNSKSNDEGSRSRSQSMNDQSHYKQDNHLQERYRSSKNVKPSTKIRGNLPNQALAIDGGQGNGNDGNQERGRAFMLGAEEACSDPNIMMGIEPNDLGFSYEIEIASRQLVKIDKVIKGCNLEIEGHMFDINLIPFGSGSFDMIIGMDWLSNHKAEIICHEKVVRIPLLDGKVLRVLGERPEEKMRHLVQDTRKVSVVA